MGLFSRSKSKKTWDAKDIPPVSHPSAETRDLHPKDILLREYGYTIHARPTEGVTLWKDLFGEVVTEAQALLKVGTK